MATAAAADYLALAGGDMTGTLDVFATRNRLTDEGTLSSGTLA